MEQQYYPSSSDAHLISDGIELQKMMELLQRQNQQLLREKQTMVCAQFLQISMSNISLNLRNLN